MQTTQFQTHDNENQRNAGFRARHGVVGASGRGRGGDCGGESPTSAPGNSRRKRLSALWQGGAGGHRRAQESSREGGRRKAATARRSLAGRTLLVRAMQSLSQTPTRPSAAAGRSNSAAGRRGHSRLCRERRQQRPNRPVPSRHLRRTRPSRLLLVHELQNLSQTPTGPRPACGRAAAACRGQWAYRRRSNPPGPSHRSRQDFRQMITIGARIAKAITNANPQRRILRGRHLPTTTPAPVTPATPGHVLPPDPVTPVAPAAPVEPVVPATPAPPEMSKAPTEVVRPR